MNLVIEVGITKLNNEEFRENQRAIVTRYLLGQDVLFYYPTGSSKSFNNVFETS